MAFKAETLSSLPLQSKEYLKELEKLSSVELIADGAVTRGTVVYITTAGKAKTATAHLTTSILGVALEDAIDTAPVRIGFFNRDVVTGSAVTAGDNLVVTDLGKVTKQLTAEINNVAGTAGAAFTNQPTSDGVTVVSSNAADVGQTVTIYGTTHGGVVLVKEVLTLNGVTDVDSTKVDWGSILAVVLSAACAGNVEVSETSGGLEIVTIAAASLSAGLIATTAPNSYGAIPQAVAGGATTKTIGIIGTLTDGTVKYIAKALTGATDVAMDTVNYASVEFMMIGDVAGASTVLIKTADATSGETVIGQAYESGVRGAEIATFIVPTL
jgi:hypothetical protein